MSLHHTHPSEAGWEPATALERFCHQPAMGTQEAWGTEELRAPGTSSAFFGGIWCSEKQVRRPRRPTRHQD